MWQKNTFALKFKKKKFYLSGLFILFIVMDIFLVGVILFFVIRNKHKQESLVTPSEEISGHGEIVHVGDEYLYEVDLDNYAKEKNISVDSLNKAEATENLVNESILLQAGAKERWIELSYDAFNRSDKDYEKRKILVEAVNKHFNRENTGKTVVEMVTVWFYNMEPGELAQKEGIETAKNLAYEKIKAVHGLVMSGGKTMEEAGRILSNDTTLVQLDKSYKVNAYCIWEYPYEINTIQDVRKEINFGLDGLFSFLLTAKEGDFSDIFLEKDRPRGGEPVVDAYYAFYKLKSKYQSLSLPDWINENKKTTKIEYL